MGSPVGAALTDEQECIVWANQAFVETLAAGMDELLGQSIETVLAGPGVAAGPQRYRHVITNLVGARHWLERSVSTVEDSSGTGHTLNLITDLTEFEARQRTRAAVLSGIDAARIELETGVLNRRAVLQELTAQISRSRRYANPLSAMLIRFSDCDDLESAQVEHTSTRAAIAQCVNESLRWVDSVGALTPGELLVVLPETNGASMEQVAQKLEALCAAMKLPGDNAELSLAIARCQWNRDWSAEALIESLAGGGHSSQAA